MKIVKLELENIGNITKATYDLGKTNIFNADNGIGKTNTINALSYLLSGKTLTTTNNKNTEFKEYIPVNDKTKVCSARITLETGTTFSFKHYAKFTKKRGSDELTFEGYTTDYYYNDVKCRNNNEYRTEFDNAFGISEVRKIKVNDSSFNHLALLTDVTYALNKLDYKTLRELITFFVGDLTFEKMVLLNQNFKYLEDDNKKYNGRFDIARRNYSSSAKELRQKIEIQTQVINNLNCDYDLDNYTKLHTEQEEIIKEKTLIESQSNSDYQKQELIKLKEEYFEKKQYDLEHNRNTKFDELNKVLEEKETLFKTSKANLIKYETDISKTKTNIFIVKSKYESLKNEKIAFETQLYNLKNQDFNILTCPICGAVVNQDEVNNYEQEKENKAKEIQLKINSIEEDIDKLSNETQLYAKQLNEFESLKNVELENQNTYKIEIDNIEQQIKDSMNQVFNPYSEETIQLGNKIQELQAEIETNESKENELKKNKLNELDEKLSIVNSQLDVINGARANELRKNTLILELSSLQNQLNEAETKEMLCDNYIKTKIKYLSDLTIDTFGIEFKMLEEQVNGGLQEVCYPVVDNKSYSQMNAGLKQLVGAKFIKAIEQLLDIEEFPILIDNAESLGSNSFNALQELDNQLFITRVTNDKEIRFEKID
ncbi:MAG: hypothetical protein ACI4WW_02810 [Candidatus Coprovivens sp.]